MITHLLLDADHVLVNKSELWSSVFTREHGVPYAEVLPFFEGEFQNCLVGRADLKELLPPWLERWQWTKSIDEFLQFWFRSEHFIDSELLEEVERLREQGMKVYVATNQEKYRTEYMLHEMGFARQFDGMLVSYQLGEKKPDLAFFDAALARIGNPPKDSVLFWDDDADNVAGARAAGLRAERYENLEQFTQVMKEQR